MRWPRFCSVCRAVARRGVFRVPVAWCAVLLPESAASTVRSELSKREAPCCILYGRQALLESATLPSLDATRRCVCTGRRAPIAIHPLLRPVLASKNTRLFLRLFFFSFVSPIFYLDDHTFETGDSRVCSILISRRMFYEKKRRKKKGRKFKSGQTHGRSSNEGGC